MNTLGAKAPFPFKNQNIETICNKCYNLFMKNYNLKKDIKTIRELFSLSAEEYAEKVGLSRMNISRYENGKAQPRDSSLEKIYSLPYSEGFHLNKAKELLFIDNKKERCLLFHGSKFGLDRIDSNHLVGTKDFGAGFYLGETFESASIWICEYNESSVYAFYFQNSENLKIINFDVSKEWLFAILYYRETFNNYELNSEIKTLIKNIEQSDAIIAPIADNQMYDTINRFAQGEITDEQCIHALSATNLGKQFVLKTQKAINQLTLIDHMFLCSQEKKDCLKVKKENYKLGRDKAQLSIREYARKGYYIDELFKKI